MVQAPVYANELPPQAAGSVTAAHPAGAAGTVIPNAVSYGELVQLHKERQEIRLDQQANSKAAMATTVAETGASLATPMVAKAAGVAGNVAGKLATPVALGVTAFSADRNAKMELKRLANDHLQDLVDKVGVDPRTAEDKDLEKALHTLAKMEGNEQLKDELNAIGSKVGTSVATSAAGTAASIAAATVMGGGVPGFIAGVGASIVGSGVADKAIQGMTGIDPNDTGYKRVHRLTEKLQSGEGVAPADVVYVLTGGNKKEGESNAGQLNRAIEKIAGKKFEDLSPQMQAHTLAVHFPELLQASRQLALQINTGHSLPTDLLTMDTQQLAEGGAAAAIQQTQGRLMNGRGINVVMPEETPQFSGDDHYESAGVPLTAVAPAGAEHQFMQAREQGVGAQQAGVMAQAEQGQMQEVSR